MARTVAATFACHEPDALPELLLSVWRPLVVTVPDDVPENVQEADPSPAVKAMTPLRGDRSCGNSVVADIEDVVAQGRVYQEGAPQRSVNLVDPCDIRERIPGVVAVTPRQDRAKAIVSRAPAKACRIRSSRVVVERCPQAGRPRAGMVTLWYRSVPLQDRARMRQ